MGKIIMMYKTAMYIQEEFLLEKEEKRRKELQEKIVEFNRGDHIVGESNEESYSILKTK